MAVKLDLKNKLINGSFDFWQRGLSFAAIADATYLADRFRHDKSGTMVHTISRSTDVPTSSLNTYSMLMDCTTADASIATGDYCFISQLIEGNVLRSFKGKKMVLSFWVKATKTGIYSIAFRNAAVNRSLIKEYTVSVADVWEKKTIRFTHDAAGTWLYTTGLGMYVQWILAAGSTFQTTPDTWQSGNFLASVNQVNATDSTSNNFLLADIVLAEDNEGQTRDPDFMFAGRDYFEELALCRRYYEKSYELDTPPVTATAVNEIVHWCPTIVSTPHYYRFLETKRITPVMGFWNRGGSINNWVDSSLASRSVDTSAVYTHGVVIFVTPGAINRYVQGHYAADAEL